MDLTRRRLLCLAAATLAAPAVARAENAPKVIVIGGGPGGASAVRAIGATLGSDVEITLVEPQKSYTACFHSNHYLGGLADFDDLIFDYDGLSDAVDVTIAQDSAVSIDRAQRSVLLAGGTTLAYDRLVIAPGIDLVYDGFAGYSEAAAETMPHAWRGGAQAKLLRDRLDALVDGDQIVVVPPPNPFRCPPGPYERVSMMARRLKATGRGQCRITILDPKDKFSKQALFMAGWEAHYPGMVAWLDPGQHGGIERIDVAGAKVVTGLGDFPGTLVNVIPPQRAGRIAREAGLADQTGWCPVDGATMRSRLDPNVFVVGDAAIAGDMPKSAFAANAQAKVVGAAIATDLGGRPPVEPRYVNTCWSLIDADDAVFVGGLYAAREGRIVTTESWISGAGEDPAIRRHGARMADAWYDAFTSEVFG